MLRIGLRRWWLENKLQRVERKLRKLHFKQKTIRGKLSDADAELKSELEAEKAAVTAKVDALVAEQKALKDELAKTA